MTTEFEERVARLEEHVVRPTAADYLERAERYLAKGWEEHARGMLLLAKLTRERELREEEADDAC